jgi:DamX protein
LAETDDYFSTPEAASRLDLIRHLIENSELVPLVRGPSGIGKTLLASRLQALAPDNWVVCHFSADSMMQPERLLAHIARCSGLPDTPGDNLGRLVERFELLRSRGNVPVLLVDDVQALPPTSLITLLRLYERQVSGAPLVSLVLFADEQIDMLLSPPQLQIMSPQAIQAIDLPPLTREEANSFMSYLLRSEGLPERLRLDESKLNRIFRETHGIPGPLASAILNAVGEESESPSAPGWRVSRPLLFGGISTVVVIGLLLIFQGPINRLFQPAAEDSAAESSVASSSNPSPEQGRALTGIGRPSANGMAGSEEKPIEHMVRSPQVPPMQTDDAASEPPVSRQQPIVTAAPPQSAANDLVPADGGPAAPGQTVAVNAPGGKAGEAPTDSGIESMPVVADGAGAESEMTERQPATMGGEAAPPRLESDTKDIAQEAVTATVQSTTERVAPMESAPTLPSPGVSRPPERTAKSVEKPETGLLKSREWLLSQASMNYTIQLLAVENIESIQSYIKHHALAEEAFTVQTKRNGKPWYPLLWRVFPDKSAAMEALKSLPPDIQKGGAWARSFASLQK